MNVRENAPCNRRFINEDNVSDRPIRLFHGSDDEMSCRANEIEPYAYLNYLFEHLPMANTVAQIEALLPWNLKALLDEQKKSQQRQHPAAA